MATHDHLERATLLIESERYFQAYEALIQAAHKDPEVAQAHRLLAFCLQMPQEPELALHEAQLALALAPADPESHFEVANVLYMQDRDFEAEEPLREAIRLNPLDETYLTLFAYLKLKQGKWEEALSAAQRAIDIFPVNAICFTVRAEAFLHLKRFDEARTEALNALRIDPTENSLHVLGYVHLHEKQPHLALEQFNAALKLQPNLARARKSRIEGIQLATPLARFLISILRSIERFVGALGGIRHRSSDSVRRLSSFALRRAASPLYVCAPVRKGAGIFGSSALAIMARG